TSSSAPPPAPMNSPTTRFAPAASASKPKSNAGAPPSSPSSASAPTASSPESKTPASVSKMPPSAAATPGSSPTPAASTPTTSPPRSPTSPKSSASGPSHSTGVDEMPVGHHRIHCARYRGSRIGLEVIVGVQFWWIYGARNRLDHLFAQEAGDLLAKLP